MCPMPGTPLRLALALLTGLSATAVVLSRAFTRVVVGNRSMLPTLQPGDRLLVDRWAYRWREPERGDVVLLRHPDSSTGAAIKRIVGLPGEHVAIRGGVLTVGAEIHPEPYVARATPWTAAEWWPRTAEYVVLGDNRAESRDSRHFGPVTRAALLGRVRYRYGPHPHRSLPIGLPAQPEPA